MLMGWKAFTAAHARPFIVYADLPEQGGTRGVGGRQKKFTLLGSLLKTLALPGEYAMLPEAELFRIAFATEGAARAFADTMGARKMAREGGWAGQWGFVFDEGVMEKIKGVLPPAKRRAPGATEPRPRRG